MQTRLSEGLSLGRVVWSFNGSESAKEEGQLEKKDGTEKKYSQHADSEQAEPEHEHAELTEQLEKKVSSQGEQDAELKKKDSDPEKRNSEQADLEVQLEKKSWLEDRQAELRQAVLQNKVQIVLKAVPQAEVTVSAADARNELH